MNQTAQLINKLFEFDEKGKSNEFFNLIKDKISMIINDNDQLVLTIFTCSTITADQMFSNTPWEYVSTDPTGNNLTPDIKKLANIIFELRKIYSKIVLRIIIGNTDPYYIYTQQFSVFPCINNALLWKKFNEKWVAYKKNLSKWLKEQVPDIPIEIVSWYEFEEKIEKENSRNFEKEFLDFKSKIIKYTKQADLNWELNQLTKQFQIGRYFEGLEQLNVYLLEDWIQRKFSEYAVQAVWIRKYMPNAILIQNEKPSELRTAMYQPLVREQFQEDFPVLYLLGVDNSGYQ